MWDVTLPDLFEFKSSEVTQSLGFNSGPSDSNPNNPSGSGAHTFRERIESRDDSERRIRIGRSWSKTQNWVTLGDPDPIYSTSLVITVRRPLSSIILRTRSTDVKVHRRNGCRGLTFPLSFFPCKCSMNFDLVKWLVKKHDKSP